MGVRERARLQDLGDLELFDQRHTDRVIAEVQRLVKPGSIVLSHDFNQPDTVQAYETLLPYLTENFTVGMPARHPAPADS